MVQAIVRLSPRANRVINIVKAMHGLKDKSQAINRLAKEYEELTFGPELRPEYIEKLKKIEKEETVKIGSIKDFEKRFGLR